MFQADSYCRHNQTFHMPSASKEEENFTRLILLLTKPCRGLMKRILSESCRNYQYWTIQNLLNRKRKSILDTYRGYNYRKKYFPRAGETNVDEWDIVMLYHMITFVRVPSLTEPLKSILNMRNALAHPGKVLVSRRKYINYYRQIQIFIREGLTYLKRCGLLIT